MSGDGADRARLDVWLWRARMFKTRALAAGAIERGAVRVERSGQSRTIDKPGYGVCVGDGIAVHTGRGLVVMIVVGLGVRRGPPAEARALYSLAQDHGLDSDDAHA